MKHVEFLGTSREDLQAFPASARSRAGHELYLVAVYVLHAFQKKTQKTSLADIHLAAQRYRSIEEKS